MAWKRIGLLLVGAGVAAWYWLWRTPLASAVPAPAPCMAYPEALARAQALIGRVASPLQVGCETRLWTHGRRTPKAVVFLHGFTNCPKQFEQLAALCFGRGWNVIVPRFPHHGLQERQPQALAEMTTEDVLTVASEAVDIACGLGEEVVVAGLSLGGATAAWLAHERSDIRRAVIISPALGYFLFNDALLPFLTRMIALQPNRWVWWDPTTRDADARLPHAYPGFQSHALAAVMRMGLLVRQAARRRAPRCPEIVLITNPADPSVTVPPQEMLADNWRRHGGNVQRRILPAEWEAIHDLIDPLQEKQQTERVYPVVMAAIAGE
jgi:carboxylesterase